MKKPAQANGNTSRTFNIQEYVIPFAAHIDERTIITKSGNLVQTIMIPCENPDIRSKIRYAINHAVEQIPPNIINKCGFYLQTLHEKNPRSPLAKDEIVAKINDFTFSTDGFNNTVFLSIVYAAHDFKLKNFKSFLTQFSPTSFKKHVDAITERSLAEINTITDNIFKNIKDLGASILGIKTTKEYTYSQNSTFFNKLVNGTNQNLQVDEIDIATKLASASATLDFNKIFINNNESSAHIAVFTLKESMFTSRDTIARFLNVSARIIVSQSFDFIEPAEATSSLEYAEYLFTVTNNKKLEQKIGITDVLDKEHNKNKYGRMQTTLVITAESEDKLRSLVGRFTKELGDSGYVFIREDIILEDLLYSIIPGNFQFVRRREYTTLAHFGEFISAHSSMVSESNINERCITNVRASDGLHKNIPLFRNQIPNNVMIFSKITGFSNIITNLLLINAMRTEKVLAFDYFGSSRIVAAIHSSSYCRIDDKRLKISITSILQDNLETGLLFFKIFLIILATKISEYNDQTLQEITSILKDITANVRNIKEVQHIASYIRNPKLRNEVMQFSRSVNPIYDNTDDNINNIVSSDSKYCGFFTSDSIPHTIINAYIMLKSLSHKKRNVIKIDNLMANPIMSIGNINTEILSCISKFGAVIIAQSNIPETMNHAEIRNVLKFFRTVIHSGNGEKVYRNKYFMQSNSNTMIFSTLDDRYPIFIIQDGYTTYKIDISQIIDYPEIMTLSLHHGNIEIIKKIEKLDTVNMKGVSEIVRTLLSGK